MIRYKLVIFDCDGVLVDSEYISAGVIAKVLNSIGIKTTTEESYKTFVGGNMQGIIDYAEKMLGGPSPIDIEKEYRQLSFKEYRDKMTSVSGVESILERLKIKKCVGSNGPTTKINLNLDITGLDRFFSEDHIFSAYDIQKWKPDPDLYLHAAKQMGVAPSECIVIEDSSHGLLAAQRAGMLCLGNSHDLKPLPKDIKGTEVYSDMFAIEKRLEELGVLTEI